jgi:phosphotransferase system enzyme I (PtsP)
MRTLDIGGDKALSYFPIVEENLPGVARHPRHARYPEIFIAQVRAMTSRVRD